MNIADTVRIYIENQTFILLPEKALYWEEEKGLIISDVHLGKTGHFRKNGIALPQSSNDKNLLLIDTLIDKFKPKWVLFLGDLFHSEKNIEWDSFKNWRNAHNNVEMYLVMGNHELYPKEDYIMLGINCFDTYSIHPFLFIHDENENDIESTLTQFTISGHVHPCVRMTGKGRQSLRVPCFYFEESKAILPAFGSLTGTHPIQLSKRARIFGVLENQIFQIQ